MLKIVAIAIVCAIIVIYLKSIKSDLAVPAAIGSSLIILNYSITYLQSVFDFFNKIYQTTGLSPQIFNVIFKIIAIGYLVEFGAGIIEDFGLKSLADKLVFVGKLIILSVSMPIIYSVINILTELLK